MYTSILQLLYLRFKKMKRKGCKSQKVRKFAVIVSPNNIRDTPIKISPTWLSKQELNNDNSAQDKVDGAKSTRPQPYMNNCRQLRNANSYRNSHQAKENSLLFNTKWSTQNVKYNIDCADITYVFMTIYVHII